VWTGDFLTLPALRGDALRLNGDDNTRQHRADLCLHSPFGSLDRQLVLACDRDRHVRNKPAFAALVEVRGKRSDLALNHKALQRGYRSS
jgi:hypothetical protein